jgi:hypothetical protein
MYPQGVSKGTKGRILNPHHRRSPESKPPLARFEPITEQGIGLQKPDITEIFRLRYADRRSVCCTRCHRGAAEVRSVRRIAWADSRSKGGKLAVAGCARS